MSISTHTNDTELVDSSEQRTVADEEKTRAGNDDDGLKRDVEKDARDPRDKDPNLVSNYTTIVSCLLSPCIDHESGNMERSR